MADSFDVFLSYAHADSEWVRRLAENLHQSGLNVFFDEWEIGPGDVLVHRIDAGILNSRSGALVVTPAALSRPYVLAEYAAMMTRAVEGKQQLIPVLLADADLPPLLAARVWIDFRTADGPVYETKVRQLIMALRGERPGPPPRVEPRPDTRFRAQGPLQRQLRIGLGEVLLLDGPKEVARHRPAGLSHTAEQRLWE